MVPSDYRVSVVGGYRSFYPYDIVSVSCVKGFPMVFLFAPEYKCQGYGFYPGEYYILHSYSAWAAYHSTDAKHVVQADGSIWLLNVCA